jgi:hypothetical protein
MRRWRPSTGWISLGLLATLGLAPAALACVAPRDLDRQVQLAGDEVVEGTVQSIEEVWVDLGDEGSALFSRVTFHADQCLVSGKTDQEITLCFRGSVFPGSPTTTITPSPEDMQVGKRLLLFLARRDVVDQALGQEVYTLDSYAECYPVAALQTTFVDRTLVVGKGPGFAFEDNVALEDACVRIQDSVRRFQQTLRDR